MKKTTITYLLYFTTAILLLIAFFIWNQTNLRWVYFFCAIVFASVGLMKVKTGQKKP